MIVSQIIINADRLPLSLQAEFVFFMTIAAICFSGLLFTLWELAQLNPDSNWTVKSIAWLMTQVWFGMYNGSMRPARSDEILGNTFLTFQQAESFHPLFVSSLHFCMFINPVTCSLISIGPNSNGHVCGTFEYTTAYQYVLTRFRRQSYT